MDKNNISHFCVLFLMVNVFWGLLISSVHGCATGYYGFQCKEECSRHCISMECHDMTGECLGGCADGWAGAKCDDACDIGTYGYNCSASCPENCMGGVCNAVTGNCFKGCVEGYLGDQCDRVCSQGKWGKSCDRNCSQNCATPHCHFQTGYCLRGCKEDFWGADCSLFGNIRDIPDQMRAKFYSQLSAESRSVLLYVLMGEYGRTLESAQRWIDNGIKQRNELRHLLAGRGMNTKARGTQRTKPRSQR